MIMHYDYKCIRNKDLTLEMTFSSLIYHNLIDLLILN